jgi:SAM-dependent methyltransferase
MIPRKAISKGSTYPHIQHYLRKYKPERGISLEVGCGAALYRPMFPNGAYFGSDVPNSYYQDANSVNLFSRGEHLPFADNSIELIFSQGAIDYIKGINDMLQESFRVLSPGGKMLVFTYNKATLEHIHQDSLTLTEKARVHHHIYTESQLSEMIRVAGFNLRQLPFVFRPGNPITRLVSHVPPFPSIFNKRTSWRNFLAWKA